MGLDSPAPQAKNSRTNPFQSSVTSLPTIRCNTPSQPTFANFLPASHLPLPENPSIQLLLDPHHFSSQVFQPSQRPIHRGSGGSRGRAPGARAPPYKNIFKK